VLPPARGRFHDLISSTATEERGDVALVAATISTMLSGHRRATV
jgi:Mn-containing catalase